MFELEEETDVRETGGAKVIVFFNEKGGVGKTTLSISVTAALMARGNKVIQVDADPQGSSFDWWTETAGVSQIETPRVLSIPKETAVQEARLISKDIGADYIVVDCGRDYNIINTTIIESADIVVIPLEASKLEWKPTKRSIKAVRNLRSEKGYPILSVVVNKYDAREKLSSKLIEALKEFDTKDKHFNFISTLIRERTAYKNSANDNKTVVSYGREGKEATTDINNMLNEVLGLLEKEGV